MPCVELWPGPACGMLGSCIVENGNSTTSFCSCQSGWSQSEEWYYFHQRGIKDSGLCFYNQTMITFMYSVLVIGPMFIILRISYSIETKSQLKRQGPNFLMCSLICFLSLYRLLKPKEALFGKDLLFSFVLAQIFALWAVANAIFYKKYTKYLMKKIELGDHRGQIQARRVNLHKLLLSLALFQVLTYQLFWISSLPLNVATRLKIVRLTFGIISFQMFYWIVIVGSVFGQFILDMKTILEAAENTKELRAGVSAERQKLEIWLKQNIPKTKVAKKTIEILTFVPLIMCILTVCWDWYVQTWAYGIPLVLIIIIMMNLNAIRYRSTRGRKGATSSNISTGLTSPTPSTAEYGVSEKTDTSKNHNSNPDDKMPTV